MVNIAQAMAASAAHWYGASVHVELQHLTTKESCSNQKLRNINWSLKLILIERNPSTPEQLSVES